MPVTAGEFIAGGALTAAFLAFGGWVRSVANRCYGFEERLKILEGKGSLVDVHESILCAGKERIAEEKVQLENLGKNIAKLHVFGERTAGKIDGLEERINTRVKEIFLTLNPRLGNVEEKVKELEENKD